MPSSSARTTYTELFLLHRYRAVFSRLCASRLHKQADLLTKQFADTLDMSSHDLVRTLKPVYDPNRLTWGGGQAAIKQWNELQASNMKMGRGAKVCAAGGALSDVAEELCRAGREAEAAVYCEWAEVLYELA